MSQFGNFSDFCRDSTLPACNLFSSVEKSCFLQGFKVGNDSIGNIVVVVLSVVAVIITCVLLWFAEKKQAAVGRREMQILLIGYILISISQIFSIGGLPFKNNPQEVVQWFSGINIAAITATFWVLLLNAIVGFQLLDDGTLLSIGLVAGSGLIVFFGTGYIAMDTAKHWTNQFVSTSPDLQNYALYVLYLLFPLVAAAAYFILESVLVMHVLREKRPMILLGGAAVLFAIGQIFDFVISVHLCDAADGKIDGSLFQVLFTLLSVVTLYFFWSSITEDVWLDEPLGPMGESAYGP